MTVTEKKKSWPSLKNMLPFLSLNFLLCFYDRSKEKQQQAGGVLFFVKQITEFFIALSVKEKAYNY
jgi:hypothetical protein